MFRSASALLCLCLLTCCSSLPTDVSQLPTVTVTKTVTAVPPANLLAYCASAPSDGSIGGELKRLSDLAQCEKDRLTALQAWSAKAATPDAGTAPAPAGGAP